MFIIYTPPYRDNSGGILVLHKLVMLLDQQGLNCCVWYSTRPHYRELTSLIGWKKLLMYCSYRIFRPRRCRPPFNLKKAKYRDIRNAIVVYPEIISGNPLGAENVVRWLLNKPGVINGEINFGEKDLFFYFDEHFNDSRFNPCDHHHLKVLEYLGHIYKKTNFEPRIETCYMIRKGKGRKLDQHAVGSKLIDGLTHEEAAREFNRCKYFVSYDTYTMYSVYAAMCGCIPIIVPASGLSKKQWHSKVEDRYGLAYGWDDLDWAISTRKDLLNYLEGNEQRSKESVEEFVKVCQDYFFS